MSFLFHLPRDAVFVEHPGLSHVKVLYRKQESKVGGKHAHSHVHIHHYVRKTTLTDDKQIRLFFIFNDGLKRHSLAISDSVCRTLQSRHLQQPYYLKARRTVYFYPTFSNYCSSGAAFAFYIQSMLGIFLSYQRLITKNITQTLYWPRGSRLQALIPEFTWSLRFVFRSQNGEHPGYPYLGWPESKRAGLFLLSHNQMDCFCICLYMIVINVWDRCIQNCQIQQ